MTITLKTDRLIVPGGIINGEFRSTRNVIHNGDFRVNQRAGTSYTSSGVMNLDRWSSSWNYGAAEIQKMTSNIFPGHYYRAQVNSSASTTSSSFFWMASQQLEGNDIESLNLGLYFTQQKFITVSFWARCSVVGTYSVMIGVRSSGGTWFYAYKQFSISTAAKWEYKTLTFSVTSDISLANCPQPSIDNNFSFGIWFVGGIGSNYHNTAEGYFQSSVLAGNSSNTNLMATGGAYFDIAKVQVEPGSYATPFEFVPIAEEFRRCMRYYQKSYAYGTTVGTATFDGAYGYTWTAERPHYYSTFSCWYTVPFQVRMRTSPTVTIYAPYNGSSGNFSVDQTNYVNKAATINNASDNSFQVYASNPIDYGKSGVERYYGAYIHYRATCDAGTG